MTGEILLNIKLWGKKYNLFVDNKWYHVENLYENITSENAEEFSKGINYKAKGKCTKTLRELDVTYINHNVQEVALLDKKRHSLLLSIMNKVRKYNDEVKILRNNFEKTFDSNISPENYSIIESNLKGNYEFISRWAFYTAKETAEFLKI